MPMPRCPTEVDRILSLFRDRLDERPLAGFLVATSEVETGGDSVGVQISDVACAPVQLAAVASELLTLASERLRAMPDASDHLDSLLSVEEALAARRGEHA